MSASALQVAIDAAVAAATRNTNAEDATLNLLAANNTLLKNATAAAAAAGATPAQLQQLTDLATAQDAASAKQAAGVVANTPAA